LTFTPRKWQKDHPALRCPRQKSNSFEFWPEAESFWELHSAISGGTGEQWTRRELFIFLELLFAVFREAVLNGEFLTKEELSSCPGLRDSHLRLGFPLANGLLLGSRFK
jgi:hypothetical protein